MTDEPKVANLPVKTEEKKKKKQSLPLWIFNKIIRIPNVQRSKEKVLELQALIFKRMEGKRKRDQALRDHQMKMKRRRRERAKILRSLRHRSYPLYR